MNMNNLNWLKKKIQKLYGKRCGDFESECIVCDAWLIYDDIKDDENKEMKE